MRLGRKNVKIVNHIQSVKKTKTEAQNKFYEVEIKEVKKKKSKVLIYFKGYWDNIYGDIWRPYKPENFQLCAFSY